MSTRVLHGDCIEQLPLLPAEHVHTCVTSPPYWLLRDYDLPKTNWPKVQFSPMAGLPAMTIPSQECCLGFEMDPWAYLGHMVHVFRNVKRVLRADGTLWVNMGDCYASGGRGGGGSFMAARRERGWQKQSSLNGWRGPTSGMKQKDMMGMPWRLAFALQADGWFLRSEIVWSKSNPLPESVVDRPNKSHEHIFLLSKSPRYFYDRFAVLQPTSGTAHGRGNGVNPKAMKFPDNWDGSRGDGRHGRFKRSGKNSRFNIARDPLHNTTRRSRQNESFSGAVRQVIGKRNLRTVWPIAVHAFKGAHFATFPPALVKPCILAGSSEGGCCAQCGSPMERCLINGSPNREHQRASGSDLNGEYKGTATKDFLGAKAQNASAVKARILAGMVEKVTVGWNATCECDVEETVPCRVIDPFGGSGTVGMVAGDLGRDAILVELNKEYLSIIHERTAPKTNKAA